MMQLQSKNFFICIMLIRFLPLFASQEFHQIHNNIPCVQMNFDSHQDRHRSNSVNIFCTIKELLKDNSYGYSAHYSAIECHGSTQLKEYFATVVTPAMYNAAVEDCCSVISGYKWPQGLRDCISGLKQFAQSDKTIINDLTLRLNSYCGRIENILFDRHGIFRDTIPHADQIKLIAIYADFLKEFYSTIPAYRLFDYQSQTNQAMKCVMSATDWSQYDGKDYTSDKRVIEQRYAGSVNGNLGVVYKALQAGENEKAYVIGQQRVQTMISGRCFGKIERAVSVFESYPNLKKFVEQKYFADKAKVAQELAAKQVAMQEQIAGWKKEYAADCSKIPVISDALLQRYHAVDREAIVTFHKQLHKVSAQQAAFINSECLTADKKGILFDGCYLQHQLVDEAVSVVDTAISCDLVENLQDAVVDLANASLLSNKGGDIITASRALDACWAIIDFGQKAVGYAYTTMTTHVPLIARGVYDGVSESLHGVVHAVCHPLATAEDVKKSFVAAGYYLGKLTYKVAEHSAVCDMMEMNPERAEQMIREQSCDPAVFFAVYDYAKTVSSEDVARVGTKTVVDMMLLHGAAKVVSSIAKEAVSVFVSCMRKGAQSVEAATVDGIPVRCAEEISSLMNNVEKVGGSVDITAEVATISSRAQKALDAFKIIEYDPVIGDLSKLQEAIEKLKNIPGALDNNGPLLKVLELGKKVEVLTDSKEILQINARLNTARGAMYEVEKTLELVKSGENIMHLGLNVKGINGAREFDIVTSTKLIECKNIDWCKQTKDKIDRMCSIFAEQLKIANEQGMVFEVHSKNIISSDIKTWFIKKNIQFFEG